MGKKLSKKAKFLSEIQYIEACDQERQTINKKNEEELKAYAESQGVEIIKNPKNIKVARCILKLIKPYLPENSFECIKDYLPFAVFAWNTALFPREEHTREINAFIYRFLPVDDPIICAPMRELLQNLIADKLRYFDDFPFVIRDYKVYEVRGECHLSVVTFANTGKLLEHSLELLNERPEGWTEEDEALLMQELEESTETEDDRDHC